MSFQLLTRDDLLIAAVATKRPVAFLVGSPLSQKDGLGVPGVAEILGVVREEIQSRAAFSLPNFETALKGKTGGDAYQEAMKWLGGKMGQDAINDVVRTAVLKARKAGTGEPQKGKDGAPNDWNIPNGTLGLAELVARGGEKFIGPILTTNFDPLLSLAIYKSGGHAVRQVLAGDLTLFEAAADNPGICPVVHLHGFWRDSDTLHTQAQLTNPRPKLAKSLQRLLQRRTLIVAAYGGWEDFFTKALIELMNDEQAPLDVIWCFYETDIDKVKGKYGKLLEALQPAIIMNRFRAFGGIDCHSIFGEIFSTSQGMAPAIVTSAPIAPLAGWELIDEKYLGALSSLRREEVVRYFDGATPTWRHAICADIPSRAAVAEIVRRLEQAQIEKVGCSLQFIRAAGGEGKTTLLLQAAAVIAKSKGWNVLWRPASRLGLPAEHVSMLDPSKHWLIVADDAETLVGDLSEASRLLHANGRCHVHFMLAARDTDWRYFHGDRQSWGTMLKQHPEILLRELRDDDASKLVEAWQKYGSDGLRELSSLRNTNEQIAALVHAVQGEAAHSEGSFFGGLLAVRFGPDGLRKHVVALLNRLKTAKIDNSAYTLFDALLYIAACHAVGIPGIDERVLADLLGVPREWIQTRVVNPLGEEAAAVRTAGHVLTRHINVAATVLVTAEQDLGADIAEVWSIIVQQNRKTSRDVYSVSGFSEIQHIGPKLQRALPSAFSERRRGEIAIAAAKSGVVAEPDRVSPITGLGKTYRNAGEFSTALTVFRRYHKTLLSKIDFNTDVRGYWNAWGTTEGESGRDEQSALANAWICALSVSDIFGKARVTTKDVELACSSFGLAFSRLAKSDGNSAFARALRAAIFLGKKTNPVPSTARHFEIQNRIADRMEAPVPKNTEEAVKWLTSAVTQVGCELQDPLLKDLLKPEDVSFRMMQECVEPRSAFISNSSSATMGPGAAATSRVLGLPTLLEERIRVDIEKVIVKAWQAVPTDTPIADRLSIARRMASTIMNGLSPKTRTDVRAHFQTDKWEQLKARDPMK